MPPATPCTCTACEGTGCPLQQRHHHPPQVLNSAWQVCVHSHTLTPLWPRPVKSPCGLQTWMTQPPLLTMSETVVDSVYWQLA